MPTVSIRAFGSIQSRIAETGGLKPEVGMGVTLNYHSDRHAGTIIEVKSNKEGKATDVVIQEDSSKLVSGSRMSESQEYEFTPNKKAKKRTFSRRRNGLWIEQGADMKNGVSLTIGERDEYYDPSF